MPSFGGGYLAYDDDWLVQNNRILHEFSLAHCQAIFTQFDASTRFALGAEYLPIRDISHLLEFGLFGDSPRLMRFNNVVLYVITVLLLRAALGAALKDRWTVELTILLFALHPVHVESVAWIASRKDVLAGCFVAMAWLSYTRRDRLIWFTPGLLALAHFSKAMTVVAGGLLVMHDLLARRRPHWGVLGVSLGVGLAAFAVHHHIGGVVHMVGEPLGGSPSAAFITMGEVWVRYFGQLLFPFDLSIVYDVQPLTSFSATAVLGWLVCGASLLGATVAYFKYQQSLPLAASVFFWLPLLPVSQVFFPLQNTMADRYLYFTVLGLGLGTAAVLRSLGRARLLVAAAILVSLGGLTATRASLFSDSLALFVDAAQAAPGSPIPPYQIAKQMENRGDEAAAVNAYSAAIKRAPQQSEIARRSMNNMARLYVRAGDHASAQSVLAQAVTLWPQAPKVAFNLADVMARRGQYPASRAFYRSLLNRFPNYPKGREQFAKHFPTQSIEP